MQTKKMRPAEEAQAGRVFFAENAPDLEVGHFATLWHIVGLGHLIAIELDRTARKHELSSADLFLLSAMRVAHNQSLRATDLAHKLHVSNAVFSARIVRLEKKGLLRRTPSSTDKRSFELMLTPTGCAKVDAVITEISHESSFARAHAKISAADQEAIVHILGRLHDLMDRNFLPTSRYDH